jgi:hypothetical protein
MAGYLGIDAIQASFRPHQSRDSDDRLISEHAHFDLRTIHESGRHGRHTLFDEKQVVDRPAGILDFVLQLKLNGLKTESLPGITSYAPQ